MTLLYLKYCGVCGGTNLEEFESPIWWILEKGICIDCEESTYIAGDTNKERKT